MYDLVGLSIAIFTLACLVGAFFVGRLAVRRDTGRFPDVIITLGLAIAITGATVLSAGGSATAAAGLFCGTFFTGLGLGMVCRTHV